MSYDPNTTIDSRVISAFFDTSSDASKAVDDLVAAGIPRQQISQTAGNTTGEVPASFEDKGFWESLKDLFLPEEDRYAYAEGLRRGGFLVSVRTDEANYARVLEILDQDGSVNMDEREGQWRSEGWAGYAAAEREPAVSSAAPALGLAETRAPAMDSTANAAGRDEVIPVYEEQLRVGKRDVNHGRVRLRSYVVETPVSEQVSLRDETVSVDRKRVDRPVAAGDALFQDRTIDVEEHAEEAVVSKDARVTEEITLRKTTADRTQTVSDTVRHTEVEVDDGRKAGVAGGVASFGASQASAISEHMDVVSSDGRKVGTVDHLDGPDRIKLAKNTSPDGLHHFVPLMWVDHVDQHVHLRKTEAEVKAGW